MSIVGHWKCPFMLNAGSNMFTKLGQFVLKKDINNAWSLYRDGE